MGIKVINNFSPSPNFEKACKQFHCESGKSNSLQKRINGLQCYLTIPRRVTTLYDNRIYLNKSKEVFKDLNEVPPSDDWFPYEYIDAGFNKKLDITKVQIPCDEMEKYT